MKTVTFQLRTENDKSIVNITKVDTWLYGVIEKSTFMKTHENICQSWPQRASLFMYIYVYIKIDKFLTQ